MDNRVPKEDCAKSALVLDPYNLKEKTEIFSSLDFLAFRHFVVIGRCILAVTKTYFHCLHRRVDLAGDGPVNSH
jgi:hypothetical protein